MQLIKDKPWLPFIALALVAQQANMLTYKFGGQVALPYVFLVYSFLTQCLANLALVFVFRNKGFPVALKGKMRFWVLWVALIYLLNESVFIWIYRIGAPYSLSMTMYSLTVLLVMTSFGLAILREKISPKQICGIVFAVISILLIRLG
ncbi:MAG: hypothetical protein JWM96_1053 [Alphaproteobacteria bacterium]|nr:hypothetical protein [Alphaproteobacteria bacterium]